MKSRNILNLVVDTVCSRYRAMIRMYIPIRIKVVAYIAAIRVVTREKSRL